MVELPKFGRAMSAACPSMTWQNACHGESPALTAASYCPRGTAV